MSTWRRKAQELYPALAHELESMSRTEWSSAFSRILETAVAREDATGLAEGICYLNWSWSQRAADEQFHYFVEDALNRMLDRSTNRLAFCRVADDDTFAIVLAIYAHFHDKHEVVEFEREHRFRSGFGPW